MLACHSIGMPGVMRIALRLLIGHRIGDRAGQPLYWLPWSNADSIAIAESSGTLR